MTQKLVTLSSVKPNPFRDMANYPIDESKIQSLKDSYKRTGYWGNVVGRENGKAEVEIAYGHHRLVTMQRTMKKGSKVAIIVRDISDADMIRMMADENMAEWATNSRVEQETIRSVVRAYAEGKLDGVMPKVPVKANRSQLRYAPFFSLGYAGGTSPRIDRSYTAMTIAEFLSKGIVSKKGSGWLESKGEGKLKASPRVRNALAALELAEEMGAEDDFKEMTDGLTSAQAQETVQQVKAIKVAHEDVGASTKVATNRAVQAGKSIAKGMQDGGGIREAREKASKYKPPKTKKKEVPDIAEFTETLVGDLNDVLREDAISERLKDLMEWKEYINDSQQRKLIRILNSLVKRCESTISKLESKSVGTKVHLLENRED